MTLRLPLRTGFAAGLSALLVVLSLPADLAAQVRHPGTVAAGRVTGLAPTVGIPAPDVEFLLAEDAADTSVGPLRYGFPMPAALELEEFMDWQVSLDGDLLVGRVRLESPGAYSLGLEFAEYELPAEGKLFLYDDTMSTIYGAYTSAERIPTGEFVIEPFPGDAVIVEYQQPVDVPPGLHLLLRQVIWDYKDIFELESGDGGGDGGCDTVHANCPEGDGWDLQKRATVRTLFGGGLCSGMLINNTENDGTQYLYTANHCGTGSTVNIRFGYETPGCGGGGAPIQSVSGATLLASDVDTDGRFMRITSNIPDNFEPYYAGWDRSTADSSLSYGISFHHPGGSPKKVSIDSNGGFKTQGNFIGIGLVKVWSVTFQVGVTEGGSSGGPLFDQNGRIRGTLTGGPEVPCTNSLYGRFHNFWNDTNISTYLDPNGADPTFIDGYDPFADLSPANLVAVGPVSGPAGGFTSVTLSGTGLMGTSSVTFDGVDALDFDVVSEFQVTATAPPGTAGTTVDVALTDGFGTDVLANAYTYVTDPAPSIGSVDPSIGNVSGGTIVTITGANVLGVTDVQFDGVSGTGLVIQSPGELRVTTPAAASGTGGDVDVVAFGNGVDTIVDGFTYTDPGQFVLLGPGLAGGFGFPPSLNGSGDLSPGGDGFLLQTSLAPPSAPGVTFLSLTEGAVPFKGGTLYTIPILLQFDVLSNFIGTLALPGVIDATIPPGTEFIIQQAWSDAGAVKGVSLTNGLKLVVGS